MLQYNVERDICVNEHDDGNVDRVEITKQHVFTYMGIVKCIKGTLVYTHGKLSQDVLNINYFFFFKLFWLLLSIFLAN